MDIPTDFTPKPGDRIRYKSPTGQLVLYIWVICPTCLRGRWISVANFNKLGPPRRCKQCSILRAKTQGWVQGGIIVETTKEKTNGVQRTD